MAGGNLIRKKNQVLINTLAASDVVVAGGKISIKQYGNEIDLSKVSRFTKVDHAAAVKKISSVLCKPVYPTNDDYGYEGGVSVQRNYQFTGDPQSFYGHSKAYTYALENLKTASSGYLNEEDRAELVGNIVEMINMDPNAVVTAKAKYYIAFSASGTMAVTDLRGNTVLASATQAAVSNAVAALGAISGITATANSTSGLWVEASEGLIFTLQSTKWALEDSTIVLTQKENAYPFSVFMLNEFGTETIDTAYVKEILPLTEVQQIFPILPVSGIGSTPNIPIYGTNYTKCIFYIEHPDAAGLVGSSRKETAEEIVEFYLPTTVEQGSYWASVIYPYLYAEELYTPTLGATTLTLTGSSGAGAGTMAVTAVPGFTVSSVKYYADASNTGTIHLTTGVVASGTNADVFYAEIKYAHLDYLIVSQITCALVATGSFTGAALSLTSILAYENLGRWDLITNSSGIGTPVVRDFGLPIVGQNWFFDAAATGTCDALTGTITLAPDNADVLEGDILFEGKTTVTKWDWTFTTGNINSQTIVSIPV